MEYLQTPAFAARAKHLMHHFHVPGLTVAIFDATTIHALAFGHASLDPPIPTTPDTIFDCASTSKSLTAAAVGKLTEQHPHISWTTPVADLLPGIFALPSADATAAVTLEDILSHRSGMPRHDESYLGVRSPTPDTPRSVTANLRHLAMSAAPRTRFQYCNMMYTAASHVVEAVSGLPFAEFLRENFFAPLGMRDTYVQPSAVLAAGLGARFAVPYAWDEDEDGDEEGEEKGRYRPLARLEQPEGQGAGSVQSTVRDFARWAQAVMVRGRTGASGEGVLGEPTFAALVAPRVVVEPCATEEGDDERLAPLTSHQLYALGWEVESYRGRLIVRHDGCVNGFGSQVLFVPALQLGLVVFGNATRAADLVPVLAMEVVDVALGVAEVERVDWLGWAKGEEARAEEAERRREEQLRKRTLGESGVPGEMRTAREKYVGRYRNVSYHDVVVEVRDGELFIDATDRSTPFWINFEHLAEDRKFVAHLKDDEGEFAFVAAEFRFDEAEEVCGVGIAFVQEMDNYLVWFERTEEPV